MSKQTLVFDSPSVLSIKNGLLSIVREGREEVLKSLEDIQTIMIDHHSVSLTIPLLRRVMDKMLPFGRVSIILVADQQANLSYHRIGALQDEKKELKLPKIPDSIEFF